MGMLDGSKDKRPSSWPLSIPTPIFDRLDRCKILDNETNGSIVNRLINEHYLFMALLENPEKVLEDIRKARAIMDNRDEISRTLRSPEILKAIIPGDE